MSPRVIALLRRVRHLLVAAAGHRPVRVAAGVSLAALALVVATSVHVETIEPPTARRGVTPSALAPLRGPWRAVAVIDAEDRWGVAWARVRLANGRWVRANAEGVVRLPRRARGVIAAAGYRPRPLAPGGDRQIALRARPMQHAQYGGGPQRTRFQPAAPDVRPGGGRLRWWADTGTLLEFPPSVSDGVAVVLGHNGTIWAWGARSGQLLWSQRQGRLTATSPAITDGRVFVVSFEGTIGAYALRTGRRLWQRPLAARSESSPLVVAGTEVITADYTGRVWAFDVRDGRELWSTQLSGTIKSAATAVANRIIIGDYRGNVYALAADDGRILWRWQGGAGTFYANPAVTDDLVVVANSSGWVTALEWRTGTVRWTRRTGTNSWVHSSPAIAYGTVFFGDYSGRLHAWDARTGRTRWTYRDPGGRPISGAPTVVGRVVYASRLYDKPSGTRRTVGLDVRSGRTVFTYPDGRYTAAVAAEDMFFLIGQRTVLAYGPRGRGR